MENSAYMERRTFLQLLIAAGFSGLAWPAIGQGRNRTILAKQIPSSGEQIPVIGMGSWGTFNVGQDPVARDACAEVMRNFFAAGGRMIDSSPMYGSSQEVIGDGLNRLKKFDQLFSTDKVWTRFLADGREQIAESQRKWGVPRFDLMQVHNLVDWEANLPMLQQMKSAGEVRYIGITTSHGRRHADFEKIMRDQVIDFIQVTYNIRDREVEKRILPLAQDRGIAVIANRPFQRKTLLDWAKGHRLPDWAAEFGCANWAQFLLKFIVSHPALTCAIPATSRVDHVLENLGAATKPLPDAAMRRRMISYVDKL